MKANAETVIYTPGAEGGWMATGHSRPEAEFNYAKAVISEVVRPALYRVVAQLKVDQHDCGEHQRSFAVH
ncbi:hypothetical protein [Bradyrhizobium uaiense]|uniref:Uncharacterized protein n=1 Tax=Bradyrhizobium uaiense TaxID=2594946 RepID=A0A6P1BBD9_9BRAD|nr:hypothetical protein [Bradyrhizobium uaiense]NEU94792.1 hypothetical protein [Bradyrhizobium uaiense]